MQRLRTTLKSCGKLTILGTILFLCSCTGAKYMFPTVVNRGILPLSVTNAYQGANLFLSKELERSSYLFRFLETRGAPDAIEIQEKNPGKPELYLYYTDDNAVYIGDLVEEERNRQWVVRGPYGIDRHHYRVLNEERNAMSGEPLFELYGTPYRFNGKSDLKKHMAGKLEPEIPYIPTAASTPTPAPTPDPDEYLEEEQAQTPEVEKNSVEEVEQEKTPIKAGNNTIVSAEIPDFDDKNFIPKNTDQKALLLAQGYAPRTPNGDIVHRVRNNRDTLSVIVEWYTGSRDNYAAVMKYNKIDDSKPLKKGAIVKVPLSMIVQTKMLPEN